ncbi:MAG: integrase core domain-containing protein, partial [Steroidobacteraceae bacterium]
MGHYTFTHLAEVESVTIRHIQPRKPNQSDYAKRFNRTLREELLDQHLLASLDDVRE